MVGGVEAGVRTREGSNRGRASRRARRARGRQGGRSRSCTPPTARPQWSTTPAAQAPVAHLLPQIVITLDNERRELPRRHAAGEGRFALEPPLLLGPRLTLLCGKSHRLAGHDQLDVARSGSGRGRGFGDRRGLGGGRSIVATDVRREVGELVRLGAHLADEHERAARLGVEDDRLIGSDTQQCL